MPLDYPENFDRPWPLFFPRTSLKIQICKPSIQVKITGITTRVNIVEVIKPPITAIAIGLRTPEPAPIPRAIGIIQAIIAIVVIKIGRNRATPESSVASYIGFPSF